MSSGTDRFTVPGRLTIELLVGGLEAFVNDPKRAPPAVGQ